MEKSVNIQFTKIADKIRNLNNKLQPALKKKASFKDAISKFKEQFYEKNSKYYIYGLACLTVLIFDYFINRQTLHSLESIIVIPIKLIAFLFLLLDATFAIMGGGLGESNPVTLKKIIRTSHTMFVVFALAKIALFYNHLSSEVVNVNTLTTLGTIKALIPQSIFIFVIYFVLTICGTGLWFLIGKFYYTLYELLLEDDLKIKNEIIENFEDIEKLIKYYNLNYQDVMTQYNLIELHNHFKNQNNA